jgi:hypothetical protein
MSAIIAALLSIPQLTLTCEIKLTKSERQLLPEMDKILDPQASGRVPRSPTKYQLTVRHPLVRCTL